MIFKFIIIICTTILLLFDIGVAQNQISGSTINSGGVTTLSSAISLTSTIGESFIGNTSGTNFQKQVGFWYVFEAEVLTDIATDEMIPTNFSLEQNFPNPFNSSTKIKFAIPKRSNVIIKVYDILGNEVFTLVDQEMDAGWYTQLFNANDYSSGVYFYHLKAGEFVNTKKMILLK